MSGGGANLKGGLLESHSLIERPARDVNLYLFSSTLESVVFRNTCASLMKIYMLQLEASSTVLR